MFKNPKHFATEPSCFFKAFVLILLKFRSICTGPQIISYRPGKFVHVFKSIIPGFRGDVIVMTQQACCELHRPAAPFRNFNVDTEDGLEGKQSHPSSSSQPDWEHAVQHSAAVTPFHY